MNRRAAVARRFVASYFEVGSIILWGKWKNHRGKIIAFGQDHWGNPTIDVEPIPLGRKKVKTMNLFHIWRADVKENALKKLEEAKKKEAMTPKVSTRSVVARFMLAGALPLGKTFNLDSVRMHRYRDHFRITDLTNAGKRGKKCQVLTFAPSAYYKGDEQEWMENMSKFLPEHRSFAEVKKFVKDLMDQYPNEIKVSDWEERAIDVDPVGAKITLKTDTGMDIKAETKEFLISSSVPLINKDGKQFGKQDTLYYSRDKKSAGVFFVWLQSNLSKINKMSISDLRNIWDELDVKYDFH